MDITCFDCSKKEDTFTAGPWVLEKKAPHDFFILNSSDLKYDIGLVIIRNKADAELIASAPDLLRENRKLKEENKILKEIAKNWILFFVENGVMTRLKLEVPDEKDRRASGIINVPS